MTERNLYVFYRALDPLILDVIHPALRPRVSQLDACFWERHYVGGSHVRVRLVGAEREVTATAGELVDRATRYLALHPSVPDKSYSPSKAAILCAKEKFEPPQVDLVYRVDSIEERRYWRRPEQFASPQAMLLLENFLQARMPLAADLLNSGEPRRLQALRLYFLLATFGSGSIAPGCVSYKSHWEGFISAPARAEVIARIQDAYRAGRSDIQRQLELVVAFCAGQIEHAQLQQWRDVLASAARSAQDLLARGVPLTFQINSVEEVQEAKRKLPENALANSPFLRGLYSDERFLTLWSRDPSLIVPRILTNLLYSLLPDIGLNVLDRFSLCYYAFTAAEEAFHIDLSRVLEQTRDQLVSRHFG